MSIFGVFCEEFGGKSWCAREDSNLWPTASEAKEPSGNVFYSGLFINLATIWHNKTASAILQLMRSMLVMVALLAAGCGGSSSTAPAPVPAPTPTPTPVPPPATMITVSACPDAVQGMDVGFYREIGCNVYDGPLQSVRRWAFAPKLYIRTVDEAGAAIDQVTLDTVANAMGATASTWAAGKFGLSAIERGTDTREGQTGWITVKWPATATNACGLSDVARDGGTIELSYQTPGCGCNGSAIRPRTARHELGHALGYWHTDATADLMSNLGATKPCDQQPSARELAAAAYQYR